MSSTCPRCQKTVAELMSVDAGMKLALQTTGGTEPPEQVCGNCYEELGAKVSQGVRLRVEQKAREQNKMMLWKSRVNLIKQARQLMEQKAFSEAAVSYEKYIRIVEMAYDLKPGEITPQTFSSSSRSKELTVITSVYWDLVRIYDTSPSYGDRMQKAANKLAQFAPHSTIYPNIIKKAEMFVRSAKNPQVIKGFLRAARSGKARCFIATSVFSYPACEEISILQQFRDGVLKSHPWGRKFVVVYYRHSPTVAQWLDTHPRFKPPIRFFLRLLARQLKKSA